MRALTDFLLREALTLLLDDPTPRNVSLAMGGAYAQDAAAALTQESQTEASEDSESQAAAAMLMRSSSAHRVMMVRSTDSAQQLVTLVDRNFSIQAFIPKTLMDQLRVKHRYQSLSRLRGSVIRIEKYHFSTPPRCRAIQNGKAAASASQSPVRSVSTRLAQRGQAKFCLYVEALSVVDSSELAVNPLPDLTEHEGVARQLTAMTPSALEQRLMLRQGLVPPPPPPPSVPEPEPVTARSPSPWPSQPVAVTLFDDHNPLLDEDCEIPEDQKRELDEQEGWGETNVEPPTDSQLIAEHGFVPSNNEDSQATNGGNNPFVSSASSSGNTVVSSSEEQDTDAPAGRVRVVVPETELQSSQSQAHERDESEVPDSQDFPFQQENLEQAFVDCSDTDSDGEGDAYEKPTEDVQAEATTTASSAQSQQPASVSRSQATEPRVERDDGSVIDVDLTQKGNVESLEETETQSSGSMGEMSQLPQTQAPDLSSDSWPHELSQVFESSASQAPGEFICVVHQDHDELMTEQADESQAHNQAFPASQVDNASPFERNTAVAQQQTTQEVAQQDTAAHDNDDADGIEFGGPADYEMTDDDDVEEQVASASQQDGQADQWMDTQPNEPSPAKKKTPNSSSPSAAVATAAGSSPAGAAITERRKRKRKAASMAGGSRPLSPQEPATKAAAAATTRTNQRPRQAMSLDSSSTAPLSQDADLLASLLPSTESSFSEAIVRITRRHQVFGISSFNQKATRSQQQQQNTHTQQPSKQYQHLLPAFDFAQIQQLIANKEN